MKPVVKALLPAPSSPRVQTVQKKEVHVVSPGNQESPEMRQSRVQGGACVVLPGAPRVSACYLSPAFRAESYPQSWNVASSQVGGGDRFRCQAPGRSLSCKEICPVGDRQPQPRVGNVCPAGNAKSPHFVTLVIDSDSKQQPAAL